MAPFCAAADWGTSSFRLWLLDAGGAVFGAHTSGEGMAACRPDRFGAVIEGHLAALAAPETLPVVICGMAGARQGWVEAPYRDVPTPLAGLAAAAVRVPGVARDIRILPGLAQRPPLGPDVMRGEETQLAGVFSVAQANGVACLPGTHSKWAEIASGTVRRFATAMTGDLYAAVRGHTILALADPDMDRHDEAVFRTAVAEALAAPATLPAALFAVRARMLLSGTAPEVTGSAVSGLLVGAEIAWARRLGFAQGPVRLVAAGVLAERYFSAMAVAGIAAEPVDSAAATVAGLHTAARALFGPDGGVRP